jgi:glutathione S-transferase
MLGETMKLFDVHGSPNCRKVRVLARELRLPLELIAVDLVAPRSPEHLATNPTGKVPALVDDDGEVVWESGAILVHLAEKRPDSGLLPASEPARSEVFRWMFFAATHVQPWVSLLGQERILKRRRGEEPDGSRVALAEAELGRFVPILDAALSDREFLAGSFSIADIFVGAGLEGVEARGVALANLAALSAWRQRLRARPSWDD